MIALYNDKRRAIARARRMNAKNDGFLYVAKERHSSGRYCIAIVKNREIVGYLKV